MTNDKTIETSNKQKESTPEKITDYIREHVVLVLNLIDRAIDEGYTVLFVSITVGQDSKGCDIDETCMRGTSITLTKDGMTTYVDCLNPSDHRDCDCLYKKEGEMCRERIFGFTCTLPKGHKGGHRACEGEEHGFLGWEVEEENWEAE